MSLLLISGQRKVKRGLLLDFDVITSYSIHYTKLYDNASKDDVIITTGSGMTGVICKLQRLLGLKIPEQLKA